MAAPPPARPAAHVVAEDSGVGWAPHAGQRVFFDESAGLLHIVEGRMVTAVALPGSRSAPETQDPPASTALGEVGTPGVSTVALPQASPLSAGFARHARSASLASEASAASAGSSTARAFLVSEGPPVAAVRAAPDGGFTALRRAERHVEFVDHQTGNIFVEAPQRRDAALHGFFWTDVPGAEFVMVTTQGLELFAPTPARQGLRPAAALRFSAVQWFLWHHATRVLLLGCGPAGARLQALQFLRHAGGSGGGNASPLRLPLLDLTPPWGSPVKGASAAAPWLVVGPAQVWVVELYRRVFVAHHDLAAGTLRLYRLYRDGTALQHEIAAASARVELSVADNVLLVHDLERGVVAMVDVAAGGAAAAAPVCPPLALGLTEDDAADAAAAEEDAAADAAGDGAAQGAVRFELHPPDWVLDAASGRVLRLRLDLLEVTESCLDRGAPLLAFLQRRCRSAAPRRDPRRATLHALRRLLARREPPPALRAAFDAVNAAYAEAQRHAARAGGGASAAAAAALQEFPVIAPEELALGALAPLRAGRQPTPSALLYLRAALAEFVASCHAYALGVPPAAARLYVDVLVDLGAGHQVAPLLRLHAPLLDSAELAVALEEMSSGEREEAKLDNARQLALDTRRRLGDHAAVCRDLLQRRRTGAALREVQRRRVDSLPPLECLEAAAADGDPLLFAAAYRMCARAAEPPLPPLRELAQRHAKRFSAQAMAVLSRQHVANNGG